VVQHRRADDDDRRAASTARGNLHDRCRDRDCDTDARRKDVLLPERDRGEVLRMLLARGRCRPDDRREAAGPNWRVGAQRHARADGDEECRGDDSADPPAT
jgi:hypothetical protein